jgi:hypothetical protein
MSSFLTLPHLGAGLIAVGFIEVVVLIWRGDAKPWSIIALGFFAVLSGAVIANLSNVKEIAMSLGSSSSLHLTRVQEDVDAKADVIQQTNEQIKVLAGEVEEARKAVGQTAQSVKLTQAEIRSTCRAMYEAFYLEEYGMPLMVSMIPPPTFMTELRESNNEMLRQCFETNEERVSEVNRLNNLIRQGYTTPSATPTSTAKPN